ncbi:MAG: hypothetical protein ACYTF6_07950, partial [Planctomycetota bacterium]
MKASVAVKVLAIVTSLCLAGSAAYGVVPPTFTWNVTVPNYSFESGSGTTQDGNWWTDAMINGGTSTTILTDWTIVVNSYRFGGRFDPDNRDYADADNGAPLPDL